MALDNIEKRGLVQKFPKFMYRPDGFEFKDYYVSTSAGYAVMGILLWEKYNNDIYREI